MRSGIAIAAMFAITIGANIPFALAQNNIVPVPYGPTVAPLAPPPQPTPSPLPPNSSNSPNSQPRLDTFSDKTARCLHYGATQGLTGGDLSAYSRACANN